MERLPKVQFTKEFKEEAVKMVKESGLSLKKFQEGFHYLSPP